MNGLDLFSGIGGISLALAPWVRPIAYCESDRYAQAVLLSRMREGTLQNAPIWDDVRTLSVDDIGPAIQLDIIYGGFPCQDISVAGNGKGLAGERSGLFYEIIRLTKEINPTFVFLENVPAIRTRGLREVIRAFTDIGYDSRWTCVSAAEIGAPHIRKRWFLLAHSNGERRGYQQQRMPGRWSQGIQDKRETQLGIHGEAQSLADTECHGLQGSQHPDSRERETNITRRFTNQDGSDTFWSIEPAVGRVVNGLSFRMDRLRCLGNAVVPMQAQTAFKRLIGK